MGEDDVQPEGGRFHGSTPVQRYCGVLGAWNRRSIWDDHAESISKLVAKDRAGEDVVAGDHDWDGDCGCGSDSDSDVPTCLERGSFLAGEGGRGERLGGPIRVRWD